MAIKRIMLTVAYDGTNYHGWQYQPGVKTIEGELNHYLSALCNDEIIVAGASRTDTGVHALGNLAIFDIDTNVVKIPPEKFAYALNQKLPEDIKIRSSKIVSEDFHPRKLPTVKTYRYQIINEEFPNPVERFYSHYTYVPLNLEAMQKAAVFFIGEHDFASFCAAGSTADTTVRNILDLNVRKEGSKIIIEVKGNGFLYNMVRIIAGTLMDVGKGKIDPEAIKEIIEAKDRRKAGPTAPAKGLTLLGYELPEDKI